MFKFPDPQRKVITPRSIDGGSITSPFDGSYFDRMGKVAKRYRVEKSPPSDYPKDFPPTLFMDFTQLDSRMELIHGLEFEFPPPKRERYVSSKGLDPYGNVLQWLGRYYEVADGQDLARAQSEENNRRYDYHAFVADTPHNKDLGDNLTVYFRDDHLWHLIERAMMLHHNDPMFYSRTEERRDGKYEPQFFFPKRDLTGNIHSEEGSVNDLLNKERIRLRELDHPFADYARSLSEHFFLWKIAERMKTIYQTDGVSVMVNGSPDIYDPDLNLTMLRQMHPLPVPVQTPSHQQLFEEHTELLRSLLRIRGMADKLALRVARPIQVQGRGDAGGDLPKEGTGSGRNWADRHRQEMADVRSPSRSGRTRRHRLEEKSII